ncbi:hypothetical protein ACTWPT_51815 [Nonomuraea sp. 3N208]
MIERALRELSLLNGDPRTSLLIGSPKLVAAPDLVLTATQAQRAESVT